MDHQPASAANNDYLTLAAEVLRRYAQTSAAAVSAAAPAERPQDAGTAFRPFRAGIPDLQEVRLTFQGSAVADIMVAGDFNNWEPDRGVTTERRGDLLMKILRVPPGSYQYRLVINGEWRADPTNPRHITNEYGEINSVLDVEDSRHLVSA